MAIHYVIDEPVTGCRHCFDEDAPFPETPKDAYAILEKVVEDYWDNWHDRDSSWPYAFYLFPDEETTQGGWRFKAHTWRQQMFEAYGLARSDDPVSLDDDE